MSVSLSFFRGHKSDCVQLDRRFSRHTCYNRRLGDTLRTTKLQVVSVFSSVARGPLGRGDRETVCMAGGIGW